MKSKHIFALVLLLAAPSVAIADNDVVTWKDDVKGWFIGVDRTIGDGCFMYGSFNGGTFIRFQFNPQEDVVNFIVGNKEWRSLEAGKLYDLSVTFGRQAPWTGQADAIYIGGQIALSLIVKYSNNNAATFIDELQKTTGVEISYQGRTVDMLSLSGSYAAVSELISCQSVMLGGTSHADPFSGTSKDPFQ